MVVVVVVVVVEMSFWLVVSPDKRQQIRLNQSIHLRTSPYKYIDL